MSTLMYHMISSTALFSLGMYHLISTTRNYLKSPHTYSAKLFHPFPTTNHRHIPLFLSILSLIIAILSNLILSFYPDPLIKGHTPVHILTSLHSSTLIFLFLLLCLFILLSDTYFPFFDHSLLFALASGIFLLHSSAATSAASLQTSVLESHCLVVSSRLSALASFLCLLLAALPRIFPFDAALAAVILLRGLWTLQTGLSLHADAFIPDGCHRLLDVVNGVEGSTQCDLEDSKLRAVALLDLAFLVHVVFVVLIIFVTYAIVTKSVGARRLGSYETLPTNANAGDANHHSVVQMKALSGTQA